MFHQHCFNSKTHAEAHECKLNSTYFKQFPIGSLEGPAFTAIIKFLQSGIIDHPILIRRFLIYDF